MQQDDLILVVINTQNQTLTEKVGNLLGREVDDRDDLSTNQFLC
jgi:hypothetical protein